jgi:SnoaL-like domain
MEQSEEVRGALSALIEAFGTPRMAAAFADAISTEPGTLGVGTDPAEWWDNADSLLRALRQQSAELQGAAATVTHSEGWVEGDVGWGAVKADIVVPDGPTVMMRLTATLARRHDGWKIVQFHASVGAANEEIVGKQLTV